MVVVIEDQRHADLQGTYGTVVEAFAELVRRAAIPWDEPPNRCPCTSWRTCSREYEILEYDDAVKPWKVLRRLGSLMISSAGVVWSGDFSDGRLSRENV
jgi:hypothetical protein